MLKRVFEAIIAVTMEEVVRRMFPPLLKYALLVIAVGLTWEMLSTERAKPVFRGVRNRLARVHAALPYVLAVIAGGALLLIYWIGASKVGNAMIDKPNELEQQIAKDLADIKKTVHTSEKPSNQPSPKDASKEIVETAKATDSATVRKIHQGGSIQQTFADLRLDQRKLFSQVLSASHGTVNIALRDPADTKSSDSAEVLRSILAAANWKANVLSGATTLASNSGTGGSIEYASAPVSCFTKNKDGESVVAFKEALRQVNIPCVWYSPSMRMTQGVDLGVLINPLREERQGYRTPNIAAPGNNSPNISAPNGIAIGGGSVINPTVTNNYGTARHLTDEQRKAIKSRPIEAVIECNAVANISADGAKYGHEICQALKDAGATWDGEVALEFYTSSNCCDWSGVKIAFNGPELKPEDIPGLRAPKGFIQVVNALDAAKIRGVITRGPGFPKEKVTITVGQPAMQQQAP